MAAVQMTPSKQSVNSLKEDKHAYIQNNNRYINNETVKGLTKK